MRETRHGVHANPFVGWNPPADLAEWLAAEVRRRGNARGVRTALLNEALADLRAKHQPARAEPGAEGRFQLHAASLLSSSGVSGSSSMQI